MKYFLIFILAISLQGCACFKKPDIVITPKVVMLDSEVFVPCPKLNESLSIKTFEDVLVAYGDLATIYGNCAIKQNTGIKLLKEFSNYKEPVK